MGISLSSCSPICDSVHKCHPRHMGGVEQCHITTSPINNENKQIIICECDRSNTDRDNKDTSEICDGKDNNQKSDNTGNNDKCDNLGNNDKCNNSRDNNKDNTEYSMNKNVNKTEDKSNNSNKEIENSKTIFMMELLKLIGKNEKLQKDYDKLKEEYEKLQKQTNH